MLLCPRCDRPNPPGVRFCGECGAKLAGRCPGCDATNPPTNKFCYECGHELGAGAASTASAATAGAAAAAPAAPTASAAAAAGATLPPPFAPGALLKRMLAAQGMLEGERKQVTILFCDIVSSTALAEQIDPEAMHGLLSRFFELALPEVHRFEGTINKFLGDGFMALFGVPVAHEDHARRAVLAAINIGRALSEHADDLVGDLAGDLAGDAALPAQIQVRMGLNTGIVVVGSVGDKLEMEYSAFGDTTNLAARLQAHAEPGTILISETTARMVKGYVRLESLGPIQVKGKRSLVTVYRVLGVGPSGSAAGPLERLGGRSLTPFVGRDQELGTLRELWKRVEAGRGQVIGLTAEPGMGKSRLLLELQHGLARAGVRYLVGRCLSFGASTPYLPIVDLVKSHCGILESDGAEAIGEKVRAALRGGDLDVEETAPYVLQLLRARELTDRMRVLSPEALKARIFEALRQMFRRAARGGPLGLAIEDLHWIDRTSEELLASLVEGLGGLPILLLCTYRPGYRPAWLERSYATQISLQPLSAPDSVHVVRSVLKAEQVPEATIQVVLGKAEGNPFFLEELARSVLEAAAGAEPPGASAVPDTVHGVLMARIDRLPEDPRRLLQTASVLGREFTLRLLDMIWDGPSAIQPLLAELKQLEFIYEQPTAEEPIYVFKHALTQDVAYESLLFSRRRALHGAAGGALEVLYADRLEEIYDRLGHHYARAEQAPKAVEYLTRFAEKVARRYAHAEAVAALEEALGQVARLPPEERDRKQLRLALLLAHSLYFVGRFSASVAALVREQPRLEALGDPALSGPCYFWLGHMYSRLGDPAQAVASAKRAIDEARRCGDDVTMGKAYGVLVLESYWSGQAPAGLDAGRKAVALLERSGEPWWLGMVHFYLAMVEQHLGHFEQALAEAARTREIGEAIADLRLQSYAAYVSGWINAVRGEAETAIEQCRQSLALATDRVSRAYAEGFLGQAFLEGGDAAQAIPRLESAVEQLQGFGFPQWHGWFRTLLGEAYRLTERVASGREHVAQGLAITRDAHFGHGVGCAQRALGRIAQAEGQLDDARAHLEQALGTFAAVGEPFELARTRLALAEHCRLRGSRDAAAAHLEEAHALLRGLDAPRYLAEAERLRGAHDES